MRVSKSERSSMAGWTASAPVKSRTWWRHEVPAATTAVPGVASRTAGDAEHLLDGGKYGLLVDPHDVESLAAALVRQTGPDRLTPADRVQSFSRDRALAYYMRAFDDAVAGTALRTPSLVSL